MFFYVEDDADDAHVDGEGCATEGYEGKGDAGWGDCAGDNGEVDRRLNEQDGGDAEAEVATERVGAAHADRENLCDDEQERGDE